MELPAKENQSQRLSKTERLSQTTVIATLFQTGLPLFIFPFKVMALQIPREQVPVKILISVSKKKIPQAYSRNHYKRLIREAYRKQKTCVVNKWQNENHTLALALVYTTHKPMEYPQVEKKIYEVIQRLVGLHADDIPQLIKNRGDDNARGINR